MKKTIKFYAVLATVTVLFSSCITATILMSALATKERDKIKKGEVFEIPNGTVYYEDGSMLSFRKYGSYVRFDDYDGDFTIITPDRVYQCDHVYKTYATDSNKDGKYYYTSLSRVFPVEWYRWDKFADDMYGDENKAEGSMNVAGVSCISFTSYDMEVAGYKRIFMYQEDRRRVLFRAIEFKSSCHAEFEVPADYEESEDKVVYSEFK
ncbi:MAG: hypothetical protein J5612_05265 [Paludibacteraceae bacterium]|nr:hypothetical protein [Paludibacteraceae bacterium]